MRKNPKLFLLQVRKTLVDKTCGKIGRTLCMTYNLFYYIGRRALACVTNQDKEVMDTCEGQSSSAPATTEDVSEGITEPSILVKACQCLERNGKVLTEEAKMRIAKTTVKYSYTGHPRIASSSCRAKSWELNYPALSFMLNRGYYTDYASIMGTMGLSTMHHSTWDNLVSWVGLHVDRLANWSCEQVRAHIEKCGDRSQWMAGFDGFYLTRGHHSNNASATLHDVYSDRIAWFTHRTKRGKNSNWQGTFRAAERREQLGHFALGPKRLIYSNRTVKYSIYSNRRVKHSINAVTTYILPWAPQALSAALGMSSGVEGDMLSEILGESEGQRLHHQPASHGSRHFCQCHCLLSFSRCSHHLLWLPHCQVISLRIRQN